MISELWSICDTLRILALDRRDRELLRMSRRIEWIVRNLER